MQSYVKGMRQYFDFKGRTNRRDFWLFILFVFLICFGTIFFGALFGLPEDSVVAFSGFMSLLHLVPSLSAGVRRLHDSDKFGWFMLIGLVPVGNIVLLILYLLPSTKGENRFGEEPISDKPEEIEQAVFGRAAALGQPKPTQPAVKKRDGPWSN